MNKNIISSGRILLVSLLVLTFLPGQISAVCSISCDGECRVVNHQRCDVFVEAISDHGCCSNQTGKQSPCCNVKQDTPEDGRYFLLTTFRVGQPDLFRISTFSFEEHSILDQTGFYPREHYVLSPHCFTPLYLQNLSLLC